MVTQQQIDEAMAPIQALLRGETVDSVILKLSVERILMLMKVQQDTLAEVQSRAEQALAGLESLVPELQSLVAENGLLKREKLVLSESLDLCNNEVVKIRKHREEIAALFIEESKKTYDLQQEVNEITSRYHAFLKDLAETDTAIRTKCKRVMSETKVEGDGNGVPTLEDLVEWLVTEIWFHRLVRTG